MDIELHDTTIKAQQDMENTTDQAKIEADSKLAHYVAGVMEQAQRNAAEIINKSKRDSDRESSLIIAKATEMARRITAKAELDAKEKAKQITEREVKHIIGQAQAEASRIIAKAKQVAETQNGKITDDSIIEIGSKYQQNQPIEKIIKTDDEQEIAKQPSPFIDAVVDLVDDKSALNEEGSRLAENTVENQASRVSSKTDHEAISQGTVKLCIPIPVAYAELVPLRKDLLNVAGLRLESIGGSVSGDTTIVVFLEEPMPLASILAEMPSVRYAFNIGEEVILFLQPNLAGS